MNKTIKKPLVNEIEEWKDVPGYEGKYKVSTFGNVKSLNYNRTNIEKILKPIVNNSNYYNIKLSKDNKVKTIQIHKLVSIVFLNHIPDNMNSIIDHIDGNKLNNKLINLRICTARENASFDNKINTKNKTSKYIGVSWNKKCNKWVSQIYYNKKKIYLGLFTNEIDAFEAYNNKLKELKNNE